MKDIFIIAEAGCNHNGNLSIAKKLAKAAKKSGADAVKFQSFNVDDLYSKFSSKKSWAKKLSLNDSETLELKRYCDKINIEFMSTPFDIKSAIFLNKIGMKKFKIASPSIHDFSMIKVISTFKKPMIFSTGLLNFDQIKKLIKSKYYKKNSSLLYCVSKYPAETSDIFLNNILILKKLEKNKNIGYSDHTIGLETCILASFLGAKIIEKHFKLKINQKCPDSKISIDPRTFEMMVKIIKNIRKFNLYNKKYKVVDFKKKQKNFLKGIYFKENHKKNDLILEKNLDFKFPNLGIGAINFHKILKKRLKKNVKKGMFLKYSDIK